MVTKASGLPAGVDEDRLAALYAGPLEDFVARRGELTRELAQSGAKDAAAWVKSLPKPVATAWAVNKLARERGGELAALRRTGDELRRAQAAGDRDALRRATELRRSQVQGLVESAAEALQAAGHQASLQAFQRVRRTFEAIAAYGSSVPIDPPIGRLHADLEPPGFETLLGVPAPAPRPVRSAPAAVPSSPKTSHAPSSEASAAARKAAAARRLELQRTATAAAERVEEARVAFREAEAARERSERRAEETERQLARQEERLRDARTARDTAVTERKAAEREAAAASKLLDKRRGELLAAQAKLRDG